MSRTMWWTTLAIVVSVFVVAVMGGQPALPARADDPAPNAYKAYLPAVVRPLPSPTPTETPTPEPTPTCTPTAEPTPVPDLEWDPRLDLRIAVLIPAQVERGQGYWKVIKGQWYDVNDFHPMGVGDHEIHYDVQDPNGGRQVGKRLRINWQTDGSRCPA
jgi:hypothetical protein